LAFAILASGESEALVLTISGSTVDLVVVSSLTVVFSSFQFL
jgi:hypothetical protein